MDLPSPSFLRNSYPVRSHRHHVSLLAYAEISNICLTHCRITLLSLLDLVVDAIIWPCSDRVKQCFHHIVYIMKWSIYVLYLEQGWGWPIMYPCHDLIFWSPHHDQPILIHSIQENDIAAKLLKFTLLCNTFDHLNEGIRKLSLVPNLISYKS